MICTYFIYLKVSHNKVKPLFPIEGSLFLRNITNMKRTTSNGNNNSNLGADADANLVLNEFFQPKPIKSTTRLPFPSLSHPYSRPHRLSMIATNLEQLASEST